MISIKYPIIIFIILFVILYIYKQNIFINIDKSERKKILLPLLIVIIAIISYYPFIITEFFLTKST